jgi:hypothetical protein
MPSERPPPERTDEDEVTAFLAFIVSLRGRPDHPEESWISTTSMLADRVGDARARRIAAEAWKRGPWD